MKDLIPRSLVGVLYIALIAVGTLYSADIFLLIFSALFALCFAELVKMLKYDNWLYILVTAAVSGYTYYSYASDFWVGAYFLEFKFVNFLPVVLFLLTLYIIFKSPIEIAYDSSKIIFTTVYLALPFSLIFAFVTKSDFDQFSTLNPLFVIFVLLWCSDTFAYICGSLFGKTKFTLISKNKTLEGLLGGIFFTLIAGILFEYNFPELRGNWMVISLLVAIAAPIGDLAESKLKRIFAVKDSSNWLPGHGGFLDRLDSLLTSAVIVYIYYLFI